MKKVQMAKMKIGGGNSYQYKVTITTISRAIKQS